MDNVFETLSQRVPHGFGHIPWPPRQPTCLSVRRIVEGAKAGWGKDEVAHLSDCPHCQRFIAEEWLDIPPTASAVARYMADCSDVPDAMELYLSSEGARIGRRLLRSGVVKTLAEFYRIAHLAAEKLDTLATEAGDLTAAWWLSTQTLSTRNRPHTYEQSSAAEIQARLAKLAHKAIVLSVRPTVPCEATIHDGALLVRVDPHTSDAVEVLVRGGMEWSECRVVIEAIGDKDDSFRSELILTDADRGDSASAKAIVPVGVGQDSITFVVAVID